MRKADIWNDGRTGFGVTLEAQHDFRSTVPSRSDVFGHVTSIFFRVHGETSGKTKITDLEFAISVNEEISWLQISVKHIGGVNVLETAQNLVDEGLEMRVGKGLSGSNDGGQIALHEFYSTISNCPLTSYILIVARTFV